MAKSKEEVVQEFRVQSIQEAAIRVISRKGMAAATMQEIAEEAGVAKGTIYLYFRDREELVEKTFETAIGELHKRLDAALEGDGTFEERLRAVMTAQLGVLQREPRVLPALPLAADARGDAAQQRRQKRNCQPQFQARVDRLAEDSEAGHGRRRSAAARSETPGAFPHRREHRHRPRTPQLKMRRRRRARTSS